MQFGQPNRREVMKLLGGVAVACPTAASGQPAGRMSKVGVLWPASSPPASPRMESFRQALRQLNYVEGENLAIELRYPQQRGPEELPRLAAELVGLQVDVITAFGDHAPRVAQEATPTIPIVAIGDDILGAGIISSLSRPGGNTTGLTILAPELSAKRLEVLLEMVPGISRVACLWDPTTGASQVATTENAARLVRFKRHAMLRRKRSMCSPRQFSLHYIGRSLTWRPNIGCPPFISGRSTSTLAASYLMGPISLRCSDRVQRSSSRFSKALSLPTCPLSSPRSSNWHSMPRP
jgi:ABC transporter substrate binding protein